MNHSLLQTSNKALALLLFRYPADVKIKAFTLLFGLRRCLSQTQA